MRSSNDTTAQAFYSGGRIFLMARTAQDGQARVFRKTRIALRKLAQKELRSLGGLKRARVDAVGAQTEGVRASWRRHGGKI